MGEEEPRFSVMLTRSEIETILAYLDPDSLEPTRELIERLERRLRQRDTYEAQERRLSGLDNIDTGI